MKNPIPLTTHSPVRGRLEGKRVLITGTGGGQGAVAQDLFARHGAEVWGCDVREGSAEAAAAALRNEGLRAHGRDVDLADPASAESWVRDAANAMGGIDVLYNNASRGAIMPFDQMTLDDWQFTINNELNILFTVTHTAWPFLKKSRGSVINTASMLGSLGLKTLGFAAHSAAKGGTLAFTRQLAAEGAEFGIRVNSLSPGFVEAPGTDMVPKHIKDQFAEKLNPLGFLVEAVDIAYAALYLASDESRAVSATDFLVDAGASGGRL